MEPDAREMALLEYGILKSIFELLPFRDLLACSGVSQLWNEVASIVRKHRINKPEILLYHLYTVDRTREVVELSNGFQISDSTISWATDRLTTPRETDMRKKIRVTMLRTMMEPCLWKSLSTQFSNPAQIVCVGTHSLEPYLRLKPGLRDRSNSRIKIDIFKRLGKVVPCLGALGYGLVLTLPTDYSCLENECRSRRVRFLPMVAGLVIPKIHGFKVSMFTLDGKASHVVKVTSENCEELLNIEPGDNVKGIILFQTHRNNSSDENILLSAVYEYLKKHPNVAFGGGLYNLAFSSETVGKLNGCGLVFSGDDEVVSVGSVALEDREMTEKNLQNLAKFKGMNGTSFGFMFSCNGRGFGMHGAEHVESSLFRSEYPRTPLIGAFTGGEYFHPYLPNQSTEAKAPRRKSELKFGYTTVFVYVAVSTPHQSRPRPPMQVDK